METSYSLEEVEETLSMNCKGIFDVRKSKKFKENMKVPLFMKDMICLERKKKNKVLFMK